MKRLYHCTAEIDKSGVISYSTKVVDIQEFNQFTDMLIYRYPSNTTAQHLRKAVRWFAEHNEQRLSVMLKMGLDYGVKHKVRELTVRYWTDGTIDIMEG